MFTGLIEETGEVIAITPSKTSIRLALRVRKCGRDLKIGDSLAVNGCCLTVVGSRRLGKSFELAFDLLDETWKRTTFAHYHPGMQVNLERAMSAGDRLGGHLVSGHIDGTGVIKKWEMVGQDHVLEISMPPSFLHLMLEKGSVCVDGISLTIAKVLKDKIRIWIIPHTYQVTHLHEKKVGDPVNLEIDLIAKYVARVIALKSPELLGKKKLL